MNTGSEADKLVSYEGDSTVGVEAASSAGEVEVIGMKFNPEPVINEDGVQLIQKKKRSRQRDPNEKIFHCLQCSKSFSRKYNFDIHTRIHSGGKAVRLQRV